MPKATLTFGGTVSAEGLLRIADAIARLGLPINADEFSEITGGEDPDPDDDGNVDAGWVQASLHVCVEQDNRPFTITVHKDDDAANFEPVEEILNELNLSWRRFEPAGVEPTRGLKFLSNIALSTPDDVLHTPCDSDGNPVVFATAELIADPELLLRTMRNARKARDAVIPPLKVLD